MKNSADGKGHFQDKACGGDTPFDHRQAFEGAVKKMGKPIQARSEPRRLLNIKEVAERLGIAQQTIYNGISKRTPKPFPIRPKRWGRKVLFDSRDVDRFIDEMPYQDQGLLDER